MPVSYDEYILHAKFAVPILSDREFISRRALYSKKEDNLYVMVFSSGLDYPEVKDLTPVTKKHVRGVNMFTGYIERALKDDEGNVIGTKHLLIV